jgi:hypothetical protein
MIITRRQLLFALLWIVLVAGAWAVEIRASYVSQRSPLVLAGTYLSGFYGEETSATLPGDGRMLTRSYRWMSDEGRIAFWPALPNASIVTLEWLDVPGISRTTVQFEATPPINATLPHADTIRTAHLLLPASSHDQFLYFEASDPQRIGGRTLGTLISAATWQATVPLSAIELLRGGFQLPLNVLLLAALLTLFQLTPGRVLIGCGISAALATVAAFIWPWEVRALQFPLHVLFIGALLGVGVKVLIQRTYQRAISVQRTRAIWFPIVLVVWIISGIVFFSPGIAFDGAQYYAYIRSLFIDGDLHFANELNAQAPFHGTADFAEIPTATGYTQNLASVGPALYWTPFWIMGHVTTLVGQQLGFNWYTNGYDEPYVVLIGLGSALAGLLTMIGCYRICIRWYSSSLALAATMTIYLASNLLYYATYRGSFAHALSAATGTWFIIAVLNMDDAPHEWRRWLWLGLSAGAMIVTYWITALLLVIPLLIGINHVWNALHARNWSVLWRLSRNALLAGMAAFLVFLPQIIAWWIIYGQPFAIPHGGEYITPYDNHLRSVLVSPLYGMLWWTPAFFFGFIGYAWCFTRIPRTALLTFAGLALYIAYNASLERWFGGGAFGMRRFTVLVPLFAIGLTALFAHLHHWYKLLPVACSGALTAWSVLLMSRYILSDRIRNPDFLETLDLRAFLLNPEMYQLSVVPEAIHRSWFIGMMLSPTPEKLLIAGVGISTVAACVLLVWHTTMPHSRRG